MGGVFTKLIDRNTTIPVRKTETFSTAADNQPAVDVHVLQGERPMAADNMTLGQFQLTGIAPAPRGVPQIEVAFDIDANGILNVSAKDKATGKEQKITITASTNLSESDVDRLVQEAEQNRDADEKRAQLIQSRNEADSIAYQVEKSMNELGDKVPANDRGQIEQQLNNLREVMQRDDVDAIRNSIQNLQNAAHALSQQMYANEQPQQQPNNGNNEGEADPDVIEGEFTQA
jgi:molecular chaperone DnaK